MRNNTGLPLAAGLAAASIWGGMYVVSKVVLEVIPPFCLLSLRLLLGFAVLALIISLGPKWRLRRDQFFKCLGVGFVGYGLSLGCQFVGTHLSSAANASLITSATPALIVPFAWLVVRERPRKVQVIGLLIACAGIATIVVPGGDASLASGAAGNWLLLAAAASWALYSVLVAKICRDIPVLLVSALVLLGGLPSSIGLGIAELSRQAVGVITAEVVYGVLFLGIVATAGAMFLWNYAFARISANSAALTFFAQPLVGTGLAVIFLGEKLSINFIMGAILISAAILLQGITRKHDE